MPPYGEPDWASPGDVSNGTTQAAGLPASQPAGATNINSADSRCVHSLRRCNQ